MSGSPEGIYEPGVIDPGLPRSNPTKPFWQRMPHALAEHQSPWPDVPVDIVIIGSGITGTNVARCLLKQRPRLKIALVEARTLCSGATGRNGGHIKTMAFAPWQDRKNTYGIEEAIKLTEFEHSHMGAMIAAAVEAGIDCDAVLCEGIDAYFDDGTYNKALADLDDMRGHAPHLASQYRVMAKHELKAVLGLSSRCVGAIGVPAASVWPYKLVTGLIAPLIEAGQLNVQTRTVVHSVTDKQSEDFATVHTSRGDIRCRHVVHATNAWLGHLLPELRPFISPVRGNVVHYAPINNTTGEAAKRSAFGFKSCHSYWLRYTTHDYDYLIQRENGGVLVGRANTNRRATGDDTETDLSPMAQLRGMAAEVASAPVQTGVIDAAWSGILGFSQDKSPYVGRLPFPGRSRQWVCGAYHGIGMTRAFRSAEMLALLLLGEEVPDEYPRSVLVTEARVRAFTSITGAFECQHEG